MTRQDENEMRLPWSMQDVIGPNYTRIVDCDGHMVIDQTYRGTARWIVASANALKGCPIERVEAYKDVPGLMCSEIKNITDLFNANTTLTAANATLWEALKHGVEAFDLTRSDYSSIEWSAIQDMTKALAEKGGE